MVPSNNKMLTTIQCLVLVFKRRLKIGWGSEKRLSTEHQNMHFIKELKKLGWFSLTKKQQRKCLPQSVSTCTEKRYLITRVWSNRKGIRRSKDLLEAESSQMKIISKCKHATVKANNFCSIYHVYTENSVIFEVFTARQDNFCKAMLLHKQKLWAWCTGL